MDGVQLNMSTDEAKKMLKRHVNTKINLVTMFVDINDSTLMSLSLPQEKFALVVQIFAQEIGISSTDICSRNRHCCFRLWWPCVQV
jgi:chemotaxis protein CheY-P-specific phosphatase CheC